MIFDTQIVSYAMKGTLDRAIDGGSIISIVANEFLRVQSDQPTRANYYVPYPARFGHMGMAPNRLIGGSLGAVSSRSHPFRKHWTDSMIMEFKNQYPTLVEYGNFAISQVINEKMYPLYSTAVNFLSKSRKKLLLENFRFLLDREISCIPILKEDVETAFSLLAAFKESHNLKANFRNSWNDLLILAATANRGEILDTKDNELSRFIADYFGVTVEERKPFLRLSFSKKQNISERLKTNSKGYINHGWDVRFRNLGNNVYRTG
jgi:hypothetical protein